MDSVIRSKIHYQEHDGELTHETSQPSEGIILDRNAELRKNAGSLRDLGAGQEGGAWGRQVATIPFITSGSVWSYKFRPGHETVTFLSKRGTSVITVGWISRSRSPTFLISSAK